MKKFYLQNKKFLFCFLFFGLPIWLVGYTFVPFLQEKFDLCYWDVKVVFGFVSFVVIMVMVLLNFLGQRLLNWRRFY